MRPLLFLTHRIPYPPDKGDKIRSFNILRYLARRFEVHLGCFTDEKIGEAAVTHLRALCADVFCLRVSRARLVTAALEGFVLGRSISESFYRDVRMARWVSDTLARCSIRDILVFCSAMAPHVLPHRPGRRVIVDAADVDSEKWSAYARSSIRPLGLLYRLEQSRVLALEKRAASCDRILFVSRSEADVFARLAPEYADRIGWMNNGVDTAYFDPRRTYPSPFTPLELPIVFTGAMDYRPNIEAVIWFAETCLPRIRHACPRAEFWIVGARPTLAVRRMTRHEGVRLTGSVADVRPYLAHAACSVAPLLIARGVQNKVLEAMAMERSVVATPAALEGITARPGRDVLVADRTGDFALRVAEVLSDRWDGLGTAARRFVEYNHNWSESLKLLDRLFLHAQSAVGTECCDTAFVPTDAN
ncbi:MAG TPA: TIGR03087 family PEP-CTERM/XrtA system glycosyltransferase [Candidatus Sulfotelmatobacter sp.]|nr:TIGR03087 family PEP-CTERM/XrtA system glycosyltransferase [Candidatus Sulfotelmatobacter sp.]